MCLTRSSTTRSKASESGPRTLTGDSENQVPFNSESSPARDFRVLGHVVMAVKRFQASLNPTITFRKHNTPEDVLGELRTYVPLDSGGSRSPPRSFRRAFTRTPSGRVVLRSTHEDRGHMTSYLFSSLPDLKARS